MIIVAGTGTRICKVGDGNDCPLGLEVREKCTQMMNAVEYQAWLMFMANYKPYAPFHHPHIPMVIALSQST